MGVPPKAASDFVYWYGNVANAAWLHNLGAKFNSALMPTWVLRTSTATFSCQFVTRQMSGDARQQGLFVSCITASDHHQ